MAFKQLFSARSSENVFQTGAEPFENIGFVFGEVQPSIETRSKNIASTFMDNRGWRCFQRDSQFQPAYLHRQLSISGPIA